MQPPIVVDFPLRGEWIAPQTPGSKIPSHGTDLFGERYAFDFVGVDFAASGTRFSRFGPFHYFLFGVPLQECYGWGRPIYSATAGTVIEASDGWPERDPVHFVRDVAVQARNARRFAAAEAPGAGDLRELAGNYLLIASEAAYVLYAHAQNGSLQVRPGERVVPGQPLARVGHSGNSTMPHLHFHLMDRADPWRAQGLPCCFREYEVFQDGAWRRVHNAIPKTTDRMRKID